MVHLWQRMHSVAFFRLRESLFTSTSIEHTFRHLPHWMHLLSSQWMRSKEKWLIGLRKTVTGQNHGCPTGIATPTAPEEERSEDLGDEIVQHTSAHHAGEQVIPKALDLHVFPAYQAEENEHISAYAKLDEFSGIFPSRP